jgi:hypothetical protein
MTKKSEIYRTLLRRQAEQLQKIARSFRDPRVRDRVERLALEAVFVHLIPQSPKPRQGFFVWVGSSLPPSVVKTIGQRSVDDTFETRRELSPNLGDGRGQAAAA